ncbi:glycosyltransferase family 4 protein [Streptococcus pasteurianus]|uniref:glycosyltransferase family 4 protein n=1 Tax=Streptococcus TaxID=1301 RepID=UPI000E3F4034|nr:MULTISPECIES: glycosyltransferase family 4 protein [Streptococcus]MCO7183508.1 glycosyltransferase family 4 protein [Streptococcus gallolyticus]MDV5118113.1 glycosyltransferase family 4 protein [Streptococcus pasteurianus]MDV5155954.1 glycosyltransferase family 4 protein [Streptococcus pasteurianus]MDV5164815.1 glycosyltransferase family 4 protein [Streptococcus pasteurianus]RGB97104.1 glycosyltransferase [Streptococcus pasteurianus]
MKKILAFNDYYIPAIKCGGPVTSINNAVNALKDEYEFYIEAVNHDFGDKTPFPGIGDKWYTVGAAHVRYHKDGELDFNYKKMEEFIEEVNPDLMWFSGLLVPNKIHNAIRVGEKRGIPVVISPRGEASPDRMCLKGYKKYPYAALVSILGIYKKKNVFFHVTSDDESVGLKKYFHINEEKITKVPNIGIMPSLREDRYSKKAGTVRAMFISRIHEVKNLDYAIKVFSKIKEQGEFDIYGPIESKDYWNKCVELIKKVPDNITIKYCGCINPNEVSKIYSQYDCFLFPTQNENYGHVIAEALANQCPVILSRGTTPWDDIDEKAGFVCKLYNDDEFINALSKIAAMNAKEYENLMEKTHLYYVEKKKESEAIVGHKAMFESIIKTMIK